MGQRLRKAVRGRMKRGLFPRGQGPAPGAPSTVRGLLRAPSRTLVLQGLMARLRFGLCFLPRFDSGKPRLEGMEPSRGLWSLTDQLGI